MVPSHDKQTDRICRKRRRQISDALEMHIVDLNDCHSFDALVALGRERRRAILSFASTNVETYGSNRNMLALEVTWRKPEIEGVVMMSILA